MQSTVAFCERLMAGIPDMRWGGGSAPFWTLTRSAKGVWFKKGDLYTDRSTSNNKGWAILKVAGGTGINSVRIA